MSAAPRARSAVPLRRPRTAHARAGLAALMLIAAAGVRVAAAPPPAAPTAAPELTRSEVALFAGGRPWAVEATFEPVLGVLDVEAGVAGAEPAPGEPHGAQYAAVRVSFDPARVSYAALLHVFWRNIDPLAPGGQFCDAEPLYRAAIFYDGPEQQQAAERSLARWRDSGRFAQPITTALLPAPAFRRAPDAEQDFARRHLADYEEYLAGCGREARLAELWGARPAR